MAERGPIRLPPLAPRVVAGEIEAAETEGTQKQGEVHGDRAVDRPAAEVAVRDGVGWRLYVLSLMGAAVLMVSAGFVGSIVLANGYPALPESAESDAALLWRLLWAVVQAAPFGAVSAIPFGFTYRFSNKDLRTLVAVEGLLWCVAAGTFYSHRPGDPSTGATASVIVGPMVMFAAYVIPIWFAKDKPKRGDGSTKPAVVKWVLPIGLFLIFVASLVGEFTPFDGMALINVPILVVLAGFALKTDKLTHTKLSEWYLASLVFLGTIVPFATALLVEVLLELDQTDALSSLATALGLSVFLIGSYFALYAFARRAVPPRHRAVALFPVQVFEDVFAEFFFANARVYSGGFFVLLAVQIVRTLGRDTGTFDETRRAVRNWWRGWRGRAPLARADDAVVDWTRIWLQNMASELTAMFVFVGAIAGEEARGDEFGALTGLDHGDRMALLGGYGVVFLFEAAAHLMCFAVLRRTILLEQARLVAAITVSPEADGSGRRRTISQLRSQTFSLSGEAGKLVRRHGIYLAGVLFYVTTTSLYEVRGLRLEYR